MCPVAWAPCQAHLCLSNAYNMQGDLLVAFAHSALVQSSFWSAVSCKHERGKPLSLDVSWEQKELGTLVQTPVPQVS